jgi:hypothetical protein
MTVIAAFKSGDMPVLVGDSVTTGPANFKSLRKKIYIVSPNFVVGWTGYLRTARVLVTRVHERFFERQVTTEELEAFLTTFNVAQFGDFHVTLVGWVVQDRPRCFLWRSDYAHQIFYNDYYVEGSGERYFESLLTPNDVRTEGVSENMPNNVQSVMNVLWCVGQAFFTEALDQSNRDQTFGFGYEVYCFYDGRFRAIHQLLFVAWDYEWDATSRTGRPRLAPFIAKYIFNGHHSIIQRLYRDQGKLENYAVKPVYDDMPGLDLSGLQFSFLADYYIHYVITRPHAIYPFRLCYITGSGPPRQGIWIEMENGRLSTGMDTKEIDQVFRDAGA